MEGENLDTSKKGQTIKNILKKYGYYFVLGGLVLVLAVAIVLTSVFSEKKTDNTTPTSVDVISFDSPVLNATVLKGYSATELQYNSALNLWEIHKATDFSAEIGTNVLAVYDGKVTSITTNILEGTVVEIDHGNGLKTTYGSLDSTVSVAVGKKKKKGAVIGKASNTATGETTEAGEVHFEVWKDGNLVDPSSYLDLSSQ